MAAAVEAMQDATAYVDEEISYEDLDTLQNFGITASDIKKLKDAGYHTVQSVSMATKKELSRVKGMSEGKIDKIQEAAHKTKSGACVFISGLDAQARRQKVVTITTGASSVDQLLGGGVESMSITEVFGEFRTGKTQICHTLCVTSQLSPEQGGAAGKVIYVDTESTFRPDRIAAIANRFGVDPEEVLSNILVARVYNHEQQIDILKQVAAHMAEDTFRLLIIDSVTALFRVDFSGRGELAERQQKLAFFMSRLMKIAEEFNVACFITNQVMSDPGGGAMFVSDPKKPVGGHILAHASTTRLYLRKGKGEQRVCKVYDSPNMPEAEAIYQIGDGGISDATD